MRRRPTAARPLRSAALAPALALTLVLSATTGRMARASEKAVVRDETATFALLSARKLDLDVPVGAVRIGASSGDQTAGEQVHVRLAVRCNSNSTSCKERALALALEPLRGGDGLTLKLTGYDKEMHGFHQPDVQLDVTLPVALDLHVEVGVGKVEIDGLEGDVAAEVGVGDAKLALAATAVHTVAMEVGVGKAHLVPATEDAERSGLPFLGNEVHWNEGSGRSRVKVEVGVGQATVELRPATSAAPARTTAPAATASPTHVPLHGDAPTPAPTPQR
jgi:hypothetical protein